MASPRIDTPEITVVVTSFRDPRAVRLVEALKHTSCSEILIADGGSDNKLLERFREIQSRKVKVLELPGNIAETRFQVVPHITGNITVFVDTDELPETDWLEQLTSPIINGECDFSFGSTKPFSPAKNRFSRYLDNYDQYLYSEILPRDVLKGAMGNSAWRTSLIREIGFDPCLGIGGEDYDVTIRASKVGYVGKYVREAVLFHDQSSVSSLKKFIRKIFYNYLVGASLVYRKNGMLFKRVESSISSNKRVGDPLEIIIYLLKPFALIFSLMIDPWKDERLCKREFIGKGPN